MVATETEELCRSRELTASSTQGGRVLMSRVLEGYVGSV